MRELNELYAKIVRERLEENMKSGAAAVEYMRSSTAIYQGEPVACLYMPKIFSQRAYEFLCEAASQTCQILDKVIARYLCDKQYRALFAFPAELEELILSEAGYEQLLPIARLDIFFNEDDFSFQFCEFNADGASAMNEVREVNNALRGSDAFVEMGRRLRRPIVSSLATSRSEDDSLCMGECRKLQSFELFDSWVREFGEVLPLFSDCSVVGMSPRSLDCLLKSGKSGCVAIVDFMDKTTPNELVEFKKAFERAGYDTVIAEIRDLKYVNGSLLTPCGKRIGAIYRRAVTCDIMRQKDSVQDFLQAARDNAVYIVGHFRTQVIHNKIVFKILRMAETLDFLTEAEREFVLRHIPETLNLTAETISKTDVLQNKNAWLIKPEDLYGSRGVYAGVDMDEAAWAKLVNDNADTGYLLQKYCQPYRTENLDFNDSPRPDFKMYNNITGMFVYNGKLQGLYSRAGLRGTISTYAKGLTMGSVRA
ncbi:MAG: hypothetical protein FWG87_13965 [Defluviitaleaceae bacterium]|nr:hypothetical protein [Defluviitaleaceae bacterium]